MILSMFTVLLLATAGFVSMNSLCPGGCKCKENGDCYDCENGFYMQNRKCQNCSTGCKTCLSVSSCSECPTGCSGCTSLTDCHVCFEGFRLIGSNCQSCPAGTFLSNNECVPCSDKCAACSGPNECTKCKQGYFGTLCDQKCSFGCKDDVCEKNTGNCTCKETHVGHFCDRCTLGKFGQECSFECPEACLYCDIDGKCTVCKPGYFGIKCNCSYGCLTNKCDKLTGSCYKCKPFFKWPCQQCVEGRFGRDCERNCPVNCLLCSSETNCTKCKNGYLGTSCDNMCQDDECLKICSSYNNQTCHQRCFENCDICTSEKKCMTCKDGFSGLQCENKCPENCMDKMCYMNQSCFSCVSGFHGKYCNLSCPTNCLGSCNASGHCNNCKFGYYGKFCNKTCSIHCTQNTCFMNGNCAECSNGYYGKRCEGACPSQCLKCTNKTFCDSCKVGYFGLLCGQPCGYCKNNTSCHKSSGYCEHCEEGRNGSKCENHECSSNCLQRKCNTSSGMCDLGCKQGYWGKYCHNTCPYNCLNGTCSEGNGTCTNGCISDYHGKMCNCRPQNCLCRTSGHCIRCKNGTFNGRFCKVECRNTCMNKMCDYLKGRCREGCKPGYFGIKCNKQCNKDCRNSTCSRLTGVCDVEYSDEISSLLQPIHIVLLTVSFVILILVSVIIGLFASISQNTRKKSHETRSLNKSGTNRQDKSSAEIPPDISQERNRIQQPHIPMNENLGDVELAEINICVPAAQGCDHTNVTIYASIERKQFTDPKEIKEDDSNTNVLVKEDDNPYANVEDYLKRRVPVSKLKEFIKNKTEAEYIEEFMNLPDGLIKPFNDSQKEENLAKNRYKDVYPYDNRRVILKNRESDYINASYVDGYKRQKMYIASIGPTVKQMGPDFGAFWNMIWQERVCKIVMLTNLKEQGVQKCDKYWPDKDVSNVYGNVKVTCQSMEIYPCFIVRIFSVENIEKRILYQMHFTAWPDKSTPRDVHGMIEFWEKLTRIPRFELGPTLVHCSAGVGCTGTFLALDILANEGVFEGYVDIFACVRNLREDRVNFVQTVDQYKFLHKALAYLLSSDTSVKALLTHDEAV